MAAPITVALLTHAGGAHVDAYLQGLASTEECGRVVLYDPDGQWHEAARKVLGRKLGAVSRELKPLLQTERPEMALVSYEARLAPPVIEESLLAGCHVLAEKPACVQISDFSRLVDLADARHRFLMLAFANRLNPETAAVLALIRSGQLGQLYGLEMHLVADQTRLTSDAYRRQWYASRDRGGGGHLIWLGIHWLDLAMYVTGSPVVAATGFTANVGGQPLDVEDSAVAALRFENGILGTLTSGYYLDRGYHSHLQIWGSTGWLRLDPVNEKRLRWSTTRGEHAGQIQELPPSTEPSGYTPFVQAAVRACAAGKDPPVSNADSLRALQTVFAVYEAAKSGQSQTIPHSPQGSSR